MVRNILFLFISILVANGQNTVNKVDSLYVFVETILGPGAPFTDDIVIDQNGALYANDALGLGNIDNPLGKTLIRISSESKIDTFASGFNLPLGNFMDKDGAIYVASYLGGTIDKVTPEGVRSRIKSGLPGVCDIVKDSKGNLYITRSSQSDIIKIDTSGNVNIFFKGAPLNICIGLTIDQSDNLYVANFRNARIHKIAISNPEQAELVAIAGSYNISGAIGFITYHNGYLYCAGYANARVYRVAAGDGNVIILAGNGEKGRIDGSGSTAQFNQPNGIAVDATGDTLYVTDDVDRTLRKITIVHQNQASMKQSNSPPAQFKLYQNYPNPFNGSTVIRYTLSVSSITRLEIFNIKGQLLKILVAEYQTAGEHEIKLDTSEFASGLYIYKLKTKDFEMSKKMLLIR